MEEYEPEPIKQCVCGKPLIIKFDSGKNVGKYYCPNCKGIFK